MENTQMKGGNGRMKKTLGNIVKTAVAVATIGAAGYGCLRGCAYLADDDRKLISPEEAREDLSMSGVQVIDYSFGNDLGGRIYIWDSDNNRTADAIGYAGRAMWYSEDWKGEKAHGARLMTPEIRELATMEMNAHNDLSLKMLEEAWQQNPDGKLKN